MPDFRYTEIVNCSAPSRETAPLIRPFPITERWSYERETTVFKVLIRKNNIQTDIIVPVKKIENLNFSGCKILQIVCYQLL